MSLEDWPYYTQITATKAVHYLTLAPWTLGTFDKMAAYKAVRLAEASKVYPHPLMLSYKLWLVHLKGLWEYACLCVRPNERNYGQLPPRFCQQLLYVSRMSEMTRVCLWSAEWFESARVVPGWWAVRESFPLSPSPSPPSAVQAAPSGCSPWRSSSVRASLFLKQLESRTSVWRGHHECAGCYGISKNIIAPIRNRTKWRL